MTSCILYFNRFAFSLVFLHPNMSFYANNTLIKYNLEKISLIQHNQNNANWQITFRSLYTITDLFLSTDTSDEKHQVDVELLRQTTHNGRHEIAHEFQLRNNHAVLHHVSQTTISCWENHFKISSFWYWNDIPPFPLQLSITLYEW